MLNSYELFTEKVLRQIHQFRESTSAFGSLIQPTLTGTEINTLRLQLNAVNFDDDILLQETHHKLLSSLDQAEMLSQRYHIVVGNPPYMGSGGMNPHIKNFAKNNYTESKADLFAMFIERSLLLTVQRGYSAMVTMQTWMFLSSYEKLRDSILKHSSIITLIQIGYNSFPEMNSKVAQACAFVIKNAKQKQEGLFLNLNDAPQASDKELVFLEKLQGQQIFHASAHDFMRIPGSPIAYWISEPVRKTFAVSIPLAKFSKPLIGMRTGDNERFLRRWYEVSLDKTSLIDSKEKKWFPYTKGGDFRRWYGNNEYVVNWQNDGYEIKANTLEIYPQLDWDNLGWKISNESHYFKEAISWTCVSTSLFSARYIPAGSLFDTGGSFIPFADGIPNKAVLSYLNSSTAQTFLSLINPTINYGNGTVGKLPWLNVPHNSQLTDALIELSKKDWDNFETSWDFHGSPLLQAEIKSGTLAGSWDAWRSKCTEAICNTQVLETENNKLFIDSYGLMDEMSPNVLESDITLARPERRKDMVAFLSYVVGCMMGRYSLDAPGLILVNSGDSLEQYLAKVAKPLDHLTFAPDEDGIIPVLDDEWFEDDIVARTRNFLRAAFGDATLETNLNFIEESLGKDLRKYFLNDFYKDHLQTYKKRPIYWLFQSPKKGFNALVYLHRYTKDTANRLLSNYLRDFLHKLRARLEHLDHLTASESTPAREVTKARKEIDQLKKTLRECEDYEREILLPLAQQRLDLDLDDGVKVNYLKLGHALATIPGLTAKEDE